LAKVISTINIGLTRSTTNRVHQRMKGHP
jgi:hypothetical protein